jgi:hypothetical protein
LLVFKRISPFDYINKKKQNTAKAVNTPKNKKNKKKQNHVGQIEPHLPLRSPQRLVHLSQTR